MKLPSKINIFGEEWCVIRHDLSGNENILLDGQIVNGPNYGLCSPQETIIYIDNNCPTKKIKAILLHEAIHAIIIRTGIINLSLSVEMHEILADNLSNGIYDLCKTITFKDANNENRKTKPNRNKPPRSSNR